MTVEDESGRTYDVKPADLKNHKPASQSQPGNDLEITTQVDGASVGIREADDYVRAKILIPGYGEEVKMKALDFTSRGDNDDVEIVYGAGKKKLIKKSFLQPINILEKKNLYETGVYNSETDVKSNPKTSENKPDKSGALLAAVGDKAGEVLFSLEELKTFIKDNSDISHDFIDKSISDFKSFLSSIDSESETLASGSIN
ncbi:MAG: hypothetical protein RLZZ479_1340 [Bacteroidota bacterium]